MKLLGSTESKINKDENSGNVPHLETIEIVLVHGKIQEACKHLFQINHLVNY